MSIIEYLDEVHGPPYLLPQDNPVKRQKVWLTHLFVIVIVVIIFRLELSHKQLLAGYNQFK